MQAEIENKFGKLALNFLSSTLVRLRKLEENDHFLSLHALLDPHEESRVFICVIFVALGNPNFCMVEVWIKRIFETGAARSCILFTSPQN